MIIAGCERCKCRPNLNEAREAFYWLEQPGAPKAKLENEKPKPTTVDYDGLAKSWSQESN